MLNNDGFIGGFGKVLKCEHIPSKEIRAVKIMDKDHMTKQE